MQCLELAKRLRSKNPPIVVDVRTGFEFRKGHIPGAIHIAFKDAAKPESLAKLPKDKDIIVYCNTGHEENKVLTVLRMLGYRAYGLKWGYSHGKRQCPRA